MGGAVGRRCYGSAVTPAAVVVLSFRLAAPPAEGAASAEPSRLDVAGADAPAAAAREVSPPPDVVVPAVHGLALMTVMRATESVLWPDPFARTQWFGARYEEAFTKPPVFDARQPFMRWDGDPLVINVLGHGLFGSELYLRARQCRLGWGGALAFATATSAVWEYAFEANGVRPSAQDLVYTPLMGLALGEARYLLHRAAGTIESSPTRSVVRAVLDPLGELERAAGAPC
ncbi:MAG: DUF3943 domain-containing protein [Labilithrix sp.]|nr:DUF3943 domain-containing protein [Labilithrix sp.]